jgi:tetratricopeptide (TPR) repeat protein
VQEYVDQGKLTEAMARVGEIDGWRRGAGYADVAAALHEAGRATEASVYLRKAIAAAKIAEGWSKGRVWAHLAMAHARFGEWDEAREIFAQLPKEEAINVAVRFTVVQAGQGKLPEALETIDQLDPAGTYGLFYHQAQAYLQIARIRDLDRGECQAILTRAHDAANSVTGWKKWELLLAVAEAYRLNGDLRAAREIVEAVDQEVGSVRLAPHIQGPLWSWISAAWGRLSDGDRMQQRAQEAAEQVPRMLVTERPWAWAMIGMAYDAAGDRAGAGRHYRRALEAAAQLQNDRPRALALVRICRFIVQANHPADDEMYRHLDKLMHRFSSS